MASDIHIAIQIIQEIERPVDRWPYTPVFDQAYARLILLTGIEWTRSAAWDHFMNARKSMKRIIRAMNGNAP